MLRRIKTIIEESKLVRTATFDDIPRIAEIQICGWRFAYRGLISDYELFSERLVIKGTSKNSERKLL